MEDGNSPVSVKREERLKSTVAALKPSTGIRPFGTRVCSRLLEGYALQGMVKNIDISAESPLRAATTKCKENQSFTRCYNCNKLVELLADEKQIITTSPMKKD